MREPKRVELTDPDTNEPLGIFVTIKPCPAVLPRRRQPIPRAVVAVWLAMISAGILATFAPSFIRALWP